ncbi:MULTISPECIES: sensor histidine kinase [unclassified Sedimentibacter]|uniref:sensor histidine kinase n=1 Tax=unclassified Sedimentibacter TaxID=2649220 RepID=UPI0027E076C6|nr:HAMP domain-containing sensor histidine kinase [Sedimentibacter sp. MB35-C1]WMJ76452.1 HAMP domain-containing sensor histidine kinase [Sedimentibacter sp. MB35-C1]
MTTIRKKISIILFLCSFAAIVLIMLFINLTIKGIFKEYMADVQNKRYERIVSYLEEAYKKDGKWSEYSGIELMHEAYMSNYILTLYDERNTLVWGMNPMDIKNEINLKHMKVQDEGVYTTKKFGLEYNDEIVGYVEIGQYAPLLITEEDVLFQTSVNKSIIASGVLTLIIITAASLYLSKQFSDPIKEVAGMSVNLSKGHFEEKASIQTDIEEIRDLRNSINILADKLNKQDMIRKRLISDINHEIRTPLNVMQNNFEAMIDGVFPVTQARLNKLNDEIIRFGKLLNNLEKLKEFETESLKLNFYAIELFGLIESLYDDFLMESEKKHISIDLIKERDTNYFILGDSDRLKQVFINLVNNAIKFSEKNGKISINVYAKGKKIFVEVADNGIGIKTEDLPFIFERLYRGDKSRHETEGSGIGLTIVKNILTLHSGSIEVESEENNGTKFILCFNALD